MVCTTSDSEPPDRGGSCYIDYIPDSSQPTPIDAEPDSEPINKRARLISPSPSRQPPYTRDDLVNQARSLAQSSSLPSPQEYSSYPPQATLSSAPPSFSPVTNFTLPLSSANLDRLQAISPSTIRSEPVPQPRKEEDPEGSIDSSGKESSQESEEVSETESIASIASDITMDSLTPLQVRSILARNSLFIEDIEAMRFGDALIKKALRILDQKRGSDYGPAKALEVKEAIKDYANENEATFVINLHKHLFNDARKIPVDRSLTDVELEAERQWLERAWAKDHLRARFETNFSSNCIPKIEAGSDYLNKAMQEVSRVSIPRPDISWGVYKTAFTQLQQTFLVNIGCALASPDLYNIFLVLEAKCMNGSIQDAENQCCRSGAAMVQNQRNFNSYVASQVPELTVPVTFPNADMETFAFSLAVAPDRANLFVHWCLENAGKVTNWHMHYLKTYSFNRVEELTTLHHDIDNILDWGIGPRNNKVVKALEDLEARRVVVQKPSSPPKRKAGQMST